MLQVVCHQMGLHGGWPVSGPFFGPGEGRIHLDDLECFGGERRLVDCMHNSFGDHDCTHAEDAGLVCGKHPVVDPGGCLGSAPPPLANDVGLLT